MAQIFKYAVIDDEKEHKFKRKMHFRLPLSFPNDQLCVRERECHHEAIGERVSYRRSVFKLASKSTNWPHAFHVTNVRTTGACENCNGVSDSHHVARRGTGDGIQEELSFVVFNTLF